MIHHAFVLGALAACQDVLVVVGFHQAGGVALLVLEDEHVAVGFGAEGCRFEQRVACSAYDALGGVGGDFQQ